MNRSSNSFRSCCAVRRQCTLCVPLARSAAADLVGAAFRPVKATVLQNQSKHLRSDLRRACEANRILGSRRQVPTCFGSSSGASCVPPAPSNSTRSRSVGEISAILHSGTVRRQARSARRPMAQPCFTHLALHFVDDTVSVLDPHRRRASASRPLATVVRRHHECAGVSVKLRDLHDACRR